MRYISICFHYYTISSKPWIRRAKSLLQIKKKRSEVSKWSLKKEYTKHMLTGTKLKTEHMLNYRDGMMKKYV
jgi:hypothetical protein